MNKSFLFYLVLAIVTINFSTIISNSAISQQELALRQTMRDLWSDHGVWTHEYIVAALADIPNVKLVAERLLKNQDDIGAAIATYYGKAAGDKLAQLLREHILIAVDLVAAAKSHDKEKQQQADKKWHKNAQDIAAFLSKANGCWPQQKLVQMLNNHLALTSSQAVARLKHDWKKDIDYYDRIRKQLATLADALSTGIVKQFPKKFASK